MGWPVFLDVEHLIFVENREVQSQEELRSAKVRRFVYRSFYTLVLFRGVGGWKEEFLMDALDGFIDQLLFKSS